MKFDRQCFLILRTLGGSGAQLIELFADSADSLSGWDATTRVSPVFSVTGYSKKSSPTNSTFRGQSWLLFLGPVHPQKVADAVPYVKGANLWLSLGLFNVILQVPTAAAAGTAFKWAKSENISVEKWEVQDGVVRKPVYLRTPTTRQKDSSKRIAGSNLRILSACLVHAKSCGPISCSVCIRS